MDALSMIQLATITTVLLLLAALAQAANDAPSIFLPRDAEVVNIVGNGFKLQVTQLDQIKHDWNSVSKETSNVETPHENGSVDANLSEQTKQLSVNQVLGPLNQDLQEWVELRAAQLTDKIDGFESELANLKDGQRIVVQVLLLNTLIDLENLAKEGIKSMRWIKNKLKVMKRFQGDYIAQVENWVKSKIYDNLKIESTVKKSNNPGEKWIINTQAIKRILLEQRFSDKIKLDVVEFLSGKFSMMDRASVYEINKSDKKLDDGLYYQKAKGRVPAHFPFSAQEAIVNEV